MSDDANFYILWGPVSRLWPGLRNPTWLSSGHVVWSGCGSDVMLCERPSLFTKRTRAPSATSTFRGEVPLAVIVMTVVLTGGVVGVLGALDPAGFVCGAASGGPAVGSLPEQAAAISAATATTTTGRTTGRLSIPPV